MSALLAGHLAVVTGGGSGIGRAISMGYAAQGAEVVILDMNSEAAGAVCHEIANAGGTAHGMLLDVRDRAACDAVAKEIAASIGTVSILVTTRG